jgi:heat shock protein HslJ
MEEHMVATVKKTIVTFSLLAFIPAVFSYAAGRMIEGNVTFSEVQDRLWKLEEIRNGSTAVSIDRTNVLKDIYTVKFQKGRLIGSGADNSFFASYTVGENHVLSIGKIGSSRVAPLYELKNFTEREYFMCMEKVNRWDIHDEKLELYTYDKNGAGIILIFF